MFDKVIRYHRNQLNVDKKLKTENSVRYKLSLGKNRKGDIEKYEKLHQI